MKWIWVLVTVISSTVGDLISAKGMVQHGEIEDLGPGGVFRVVRYIATHKLVLAGLGSNAISFASFLALLSVSDLSFAVPVTSLGYVLKTVLAQFYLGESVTWRRWVGTVLVSIGIVLISF